MYCLLSLLFCVICGHFSELSLSRFPTLKRKTMRHSPFRKAPFENQKIPDQTDRAATNQTQNPNTNVLVSFQLNSNTIRALQPTPSGSSVSIIPDLNIVKACVHIHHDIRALKTQFLGWMENAECRVRSMENMECGNCGVWKMRSVENEEYREYGVWKMRSVWKCTNFDRFIHFKAFKCIYST